MKYLAIVHVRAFIRIAGHGSAVTVSINSSLDTEAFHRSPSGEMSSFPPPSVSGLDSRHRKQCVRH